MKNKIIIYGFVLVTSIITTSCNSGNSSGKIKEPFKIETYASAKEIIPGQWISSETIYGNYTQYNILLFKNDGLLKFGQGGSKEQALKLANESVLVGKWSVNENPNLLTNLINDQRFLINFELDGYGSEILRVEIHPKQHRMGRIANENDAFSSDAGIFTFGGKIFYKE